MLAVWQEIWLRNRATRAVLVAIYISSLGTVIAMVLGASLGGSMHVRPWVFLVAGLVTSAGLVTLLWRRASRPPSQQARRKRPL